MGTVDPDLTTEHLRAAVPDVRPLSQTDPERVATMTAWLEQHTKAAGSAPSPSPSRNGTPRKRRVAL